MIDATKLGNLRITEGANKLEAQYAEEHRRAGARLRRRYYRGVAMKSTGGGASHTGVSGPPKVPHKGQTPYNPADHPRTILAGGRKLHQPKPVIVITPPPVIVAAPLPEPEPVVIKEEATPMPIDTVVLAQVDNTEGGAWSLVRNTKTRKVHAIRADKPGKVPNLKWADAVALVEGWRDNEFTEYFTVLDEKLADAIAEDDED